MLCVDLSAEHVRAHIAEYLAVHVDASARAPTNSFTSCLTRWELSFAYWDPLPIAYCVMSRKFGPPHIHQVMVASSRRGAGVGTIMLAGAMRRGAETPKVDRDNARAIRFYCRHGWLIRGEQSRYLWLCAPAVECQQRLQIEGP